MSGRRREGTGEQGQALLELALIAPVLILLLAALVQFGIIFERQIGINNAIREAARRAATFDTKDTATADANAAWTVTTLRSLLGNSQTYDESRMTIEVCIGTPSANPRDPSGNYQVNVRVKVWYRHPLFLPIADVLLDGIDGTSDRSLLATNSTEFHVEQSGTNNLASRAAKFPIDLTATCTM